MQHSQTERQKILSRVDHDLYLENVHKSTYQKEVEAKWIAGEITDLERTKLILQSVGVEDVV